MEKRPNPRLAVGNRKRIWYYPEKPDSPFHIFMRRSFPIFLLLLLAAAACGSKPPAPAPTPPAKTPDAPLVFDRVLPQFNGELEKTGKKAFNRGELEKKMTGATVETKWQPANGYDVYTAVVSGPLGKTTAKCRVRAFSKPGSPDVEYYAFTYFEIADADFSTEKLIEIVVKHFGDASAQDTQDGSAIWDFPLGRLLLLGDSQDHALEDESFTFEFRPRTPAPASTENPDKQLVPDHD